MSVYDIETQGNKTMSAQVNNLTSTLPCDGRELSTGSQKALAFISLPPRPDTTAFSFFHLEGD